MNLVGKKVRFPLNTTERLNFNSLPDWVAAAARQLLSQGYQAYLVGGAVRDLLRGEPPHDWDLATDALPDQVETLYLHTVPTGKNYGTITVLFEAGQLEVTTFREDLGYSDRRRPDAIKFGSEITQDLLRRDFTINALAFDFATEELVDPSGGYYDLRQQILRAVGDPGVRFAEDGLRMFRFYRFLATADLRADVKTLKAVNPEWGKLVSNERIREEFSKLLLGKNVRSGLNGLRNSGLLGVFIPELNGIDIEQGWYHHHRLWEHLVIATESIQPRIELRLAALLHDVAKPQTQFADETGVHFYGHDQQGAAMAETILRRLRYPNQLVETVTKLIRWHMFFIEPKTSDGALRRLIAKVGPEQIDDLLELRRADIVATGRVDAAAWADWHHLVERFHALLTDDTVLGRYQLAVNGRDLMNRFGLQPGPVVGRLLNALWQRVLEEPAHNNRDTLFQFAADLISREQPPENEKT